MEYFTLLKIFGEPVSFIPTSTALVSFVMVIVVILVHYVPILMFY